MSTLFMLTQILAMPSQADGPFDRLKAGLHRQLKQNYHVKEVHHGPPYDLGQLASMVDIVEEGILDDGTVVIKRPDIWSQARMTKYRVDFEKQMEEELDNFAAVLSARVARSDQASFESATSLGAALSGTPQIAPSAGGDANLAQSQADLVAAQAQLVTAQGELTKTQNEIAKQNQALLLRSTEGASTVSAISQTQSFQLLNEKGAFQDIDDKYLSSGNLGLEPTIYLDEKKRYLDHLNEIRRVNLGDDNADSAGYSLSLVRLPVSIQPGEKTKRGHGASLTITARPEFRPDFLPTTYRNLVIHDIVDQLTPILYEALDRGLDIEYLAYLQKKQELAAQSEEKRKEVQSREIRLQQESALLGGLNQLNSPDSLVPPNSQQQLQELLREQPTLDRSQRMEEILTPSGSEANNARNKQSDTPLSLMRTLNEKQKSALEDLDRIKAEERQNEQEQIENLGKAIYAKIPSNRLASRPYPIAPTDMRKVFLNDNLLRLAAVIRRAQPTLTPRAAEIRAFLAQTAEPAYELMPAYAGMIEAIAESVQSHAFETLPGLFAQLASVLPNDLALHGEDPVAILAWAIAVDAGLLNDRLIEEMKRLAGQNGFHPACDLEATLFYLPEPQPGAGETFQAYVNARWPIICFALDPVTDQQNIADALSLRRDLQLAVAFAFARGRINFSQFNRFRRRIELDAETIALNRTVTAFAHGNETFGWRFYPRYQNPPQEASNFHVIANQLIRGGPGRDYQIKNSQLEAGQRELTAVVIMPSFLPKMRFEVIGNWFDLRQPDDYTVPTARMVWEGQQVIKLRQALLHGCDPTQYRPGDYQRVLTKIDQVEQMLPLQTEIVNVPYENAQGGFDLFTPGLASLAPVMLGYDGIDLIEPDSDAAFMIFGKNFSIHETKFVAGGRPLSDDRVEILSREVVRLNIPGDVLETTLADRPDRQFVEVIAATPNGISNRLTIPTQAKAEAKASPAGSGYSWTAPPEYTLYYLYNDAAPQDPEIPSFIKIDRATSGDPSILAANQSFLSNPDAPPPLIPQSVKYMAMRLWLKDKNGKDVTLDARTTKPENANFGGGSNSAAAQIGFVENICKPVIEALKKSNGLRESRFPKDLEIQVQTYIILEGNSASIRLDNNFKIQLIAREPAPPAANSGTIPTFVPKPPPTPQPKPDNAPPIEDPVPSALPDETNGNGAGS